MKLREECILFSIWIIIIFLIKVNSKTFQFWIIVYSFGHTSHLFHVSIPINFCIFWNRLFKQHFTHIERHKKFFYKKEHTRNFVDNQQIQNEFTKDQKNGKRNQIFSIIEELNPERNIFENFTCFRVECCHLSIDLPKSTSIQNLLFVMIGPLPKIQNSNSKLCDIS